MPTVTDSNHPDHATLSAYRCGRLTGADRAAVAEHLARCARCSGEFPEHTPTQYTVVAPGDGPVAGVPPALVDHPRYRVLDRIGEGGMGVVYRAEHRVMGRVVALKVLNAGVTANPTAVDRFRREVRLASRLNHANIVTAYDADEAGGLHFLVMEFVEGSSLDGLVRSRGPLPVSVACECCRQAAIGLQHAHEKGMVHRDIKPHNLMLTKSGQVKILDFGLACVAASSGTDPTSITAHALTQPHTLLGTPDFLSPEQARSATALDVRSDLYSLGCTLYYLLAGKPPFGGTGAYAKMIAHVKDPVPDLLAVRPDAPPELAALLRKLMAKTPEERYQTPTEVAAALRPFTESDTDASALEMIPGPLDVNSSAVTTWGETLPSYAFSAATAALPMAAECEPSDPELSAVPLTEAAPAPVAARTTHRGLFAVAAIVLLGLVLGGLVSQRHRFLDSPDAPKQIAKEEPPSQPSANQTPNGPTTAPLPHPEPTQPTPPVVTPKHPPVKPLVPTPPPPVVPVRKKQILVLIPPDFASNELTLVTERLELRGAEVLLVGSEKKPLDGFRYVYQKEPTYQRTITPDFGAKDITTGQLDAVDAVIIIPGNMKEFEPKGVAATEFTRIIKKMIQQKKVVGAVSTGIFALGTHGFLEQVEVSTYTGHQAQEKLKVKKWTADPKVVIDLPFITAGEYAPTRTLTDEVLKAIPDHTAK